MSAERWQEVGRLFHEALQRDVEDRSVYLDSTCGSDVALKDEVLSLLRCDADATPFLEQPAIEQAARQLADDGWSPPQPQPTCIAGYTIVKEIGDGGMGVVYLAEQDSPIHRRVALKLIKPGMDTRQVVARFNAERQALALMQHANIAAVHEAGATADGRPYFVMEYVDGCPITAYSDGRRLTVRDRLALAIDVCDAIQHAHQKGVIHRDIKPSNVLVQTQDGRPVAKIIDFGIARATSPGPRTVSEVTDHGQRVGTLDYMSPEQADPVGGDVDTRTDIYALGVLLYELLVGVLPVDRSSASPEPVRPSARLTALAGQAADIARARQTSVASLARELRGDLDWIVLKALDRDRARRYASASELAADIARHLHDQPVVARPPSTAYRVRKFARRYRTAVLAVAVLALVTLGGLGVAANLYARMVHQRDEANRLRAQADQERIHAEQATNEATAQRSAATQAATAAVFQSRRAIVEANAAVAARQEAEYRAYTATIAAADGELRAGFSEEAKRRLLAVPEALRQWEWRHLSLATDESVASLTAPVRCVSRRGEPFVNHNYDLDFQAQGGRIAFTQCNGVDSWDASSFSAVSQVFPGEVLVTGANDATLVAVRNGTDSEPWDADLIDASSMHVVRRLGPYAQAPVCAALSADRALAAIGLTPEISQNAEALEDVFEIWDVAAARRVARLAPATPPFYDTRYSRPARCQIRFSPDGTRVATSGATVHVWSSGSGVEIAADARQAGVLPQPIAFSPRGSELAIGRDTGFVDLFDVASGRLTHLDGAGLVRATSTSMTAGQRREFMYMTPEQQVRAIAFSPNGSQIASVAGHAVGLWDVATHELTRFLSGHSNPVVSLAYSPDNRRLYSADVAGQVRGWDILNVGAVKNVQGSFDPHAIALSSDGTSISVSQMDGELSVWRLADFRKIILRPGTASRSMTASGAIAISGDGQHVYASELDNVGTVRDWNVGTGQTMAYALNATVEAGCKFPSPRRSVDDFKLSPNGQFLAYLQGLCIVVRDLQAKRTTAVLNSHAVPLPAFAFLPDGQLVIGGYRLDARSSPTMVIWDWRANRIVRSVPAPIGAKQMSLALSVSGDGRRIAVREYDPSVIFIWDGALGHELGRLTLTSGLAAGAAPFIGVGCMAFSPDGLRLATSGTDNVVRVWDADMFQLVLLLSDNAQHNPAQNTGLVFTPGGRLIASRTGGGLTIWESRASGTVSAQVSRLPW